MKPDAQEIEYRVKCGKETHTILFRANGSIKLCDHPRHKSPAGERRLFLERLEAKTLLLGDSLQKLGAPQHCYRALLGMRLALRDCTIRWSPILHDDVSAAANPEKLRQVYDPLMMLVATNYEREVRRAALTGVEVSVSAPRRPGAAPRREPPRPGLALVFKPLAKELKDDVMHAGDAIGEIKSKIYRRQSSHRVSPRRPRSFGAAASWDEVKDVYRTRIGRKLTRGGAKPAAISGLISELIRVTIQTERVKHLQALMYGLERFDRTREILGSRPGEGYVLVPPCHALRWWANLYTKPNLFGIVALLTRSGMEKTAKKEWQLGAINVTFDSEARGWHLAGSVSKWP